MSVTREEAERIWLYMSTCIMHAKTSNASKPYADRIIDNIVRVADGLEPGRLWEQGPDLEAFRIE